MVTSLELYLLPMNMHSFKRGQQITKCISFIFGFFSSFGALVHIIN
uniref:Uncharacterized protein n=1 Tax=Rhizophora mucronata TaxID=61149 RepID=A0A2P2N703_RHIMU